MHNFDIYISKDTNTSSFEETKLYENALKMMGVLFEKNEILKKSALKDLADKTTLGFDVMLCDDKTIQTMNKDFRSKDVPTDVLSFALFADSQQQFQMEEISLGEIIISLETAQKQANENSKSLEDEVNFLLIHGILHLIGFDHKDEESYEFMVNLQNEILSKI